MSKIFYRFDYRKKYKAEYCKTNLIKNKKEKATIKVFLKKRTSFSSL